MALSLRQYRAVLGTYLRVQRRPLALLALLLLGGMAVQLGLPQVVRRFIDAVQAGGSLSQLRDAALLFCGGALLKYAIGIASTYVSQRVGWRATNALRADLASHCLGLDLPFHQAHTPGALLERIDGDVGVLANFLSQFVLQIVASLLLLVGVLVVLGLEDWRVGLAFCAFTVLALLLLGSMRSIATPAFVAEREASAALFGFLEERIGGVEDIRANGGVAFTLHGLTRRMTERWRSEFRAYMKVARLRTATSALFAFGGALALALGAWLYHEGAISLGTVYLVFAYVQLLAQPIERLSLELQDLQTATASLQRVAELQRATPSVPDSGETPLPDGALAVAFEGVSFAYPSAVARAPDADDQVAFALRDVSFTLAPGQMLGLLGRTGSGKSTIARLLSRLYDPQQGSIRLGTLDVRDVPLAELRARVGVVTQDVQLFHATLRDNLTFFDRRIADDQLLAVLQRVGLEAWYDALPHGLNTVLDAGRLSAGEAQLLALARVFLRDPQLVILDEASARLDPLTERLLDAAMAELLANRTAIIVAHRLETVQRVDLILILEDGCVVEAGDRAVLAAAPASRFAGLLRAGLHNIAAPQ